MVNAKEIGLHNAKANLAKYRMFEGERETGYDGHQEWSDDDPLMLEAQAFFYKAVKKRYFLEVRSFLGILMPNGADDARLPEIQRLLTNIFSEEALKEALLLSIATGSRPLVEFVLALFIDCPYLERSGCSDSKNFPPHMTPLMLACILNNISIVQCLLRRGHTIQIPHFLTCECDVCKRQTLSTRSNARIVDVMRAVSSEAYLWLATDDVMAATCAVARDLQQLIRDDSLEQVETYRVLETNVQRFMARLSDCAWRADEFNVLVSNKSHCARRNTELPAPRLHMAMDSHMRQFTCSTNTQNAMKSAFRADWFNFGNKPKRDTWRFLRATVLMPLLVLIHSALPNQATTMAVPLARFIAHIATYVLFLVAAVVRPTIAFYSDWNVADDPIAFGLEAFMYAYMMGLLVEKACLFYPLGSATFFAFWWRWFDVLLIVAFLLAFLFFVASHHSREPFDPRTIDRAHWPSGEFALLHEIFLSVSCVLGVSKCFYYMQMMRGIGGSVISVGKCVGKTYTYLIIMVTIIFSFSVGLNILVGPYANRKSMSADGKVEQQTTDNYDNLGTSSKNLFWSIFGYLGPSTYITVVGNTGLHMEPVAHHLNSATLEVLGALYHGIIIITVMNLMTSLLVKKADEVLDNEEMEYKYTRAAIYAEFLPWQMAAPPPLNLILIVAHWLHRKAGRKLASPSWGTKPENEDDEKKNGKQKRQSGGADETTTQRAEHRSKEQTLAAAAPTAATELVTIEQQKEKKKKDEPAAATEPKRRGEEEKKVCSRHPYLAVILALFNRFCAAKECKYKSVWRTEFEKEEKQSSVVSFLPSGYRPFPMDNTYEGFRMRKSRKMHMEPADEMGHQDDGKKATSVRYLGKGKLRTDARLRFEQEEEERKKKEAAAGAQAAAPGAQAAAPGAQTAAPGAQAAAPGAQAAVPGAQAAAPGAPKAPKSKEDATKK